MRALSQVVRGFWQRSKNYIGVLRLEISLEIEDTLKGVVVIPTSLVVVELS